MQTEDKLEKMLERLGALEHEYHSDKKVVKVVAAVFAILLVAFFGISLSQIHSKVDEAMSTTAVKGYEKNAEKSAGKAKQYESNAEIAAKHIEDLEVYAEEILKPLKENYKLVEFNKLYIDGPYREIISSAKSAKGYTSYGPVFSAFVKQKE